MIDSFIVFFFVQNATKEKFVKESMLTLSFIIAFSYKENFFFFFDEVQSFSKIVD